MCAACLKSGDFSYGGEVLEGRVLLAAKVIVAPETYEFRDMGFDPATQEVGIVGYEGTGTIGVTKIAKLFELNEAGNGFTAQTLVGLGPGTQVGGISSDASRIAGVSKSPGSISIGEGTTWLRTSPSLPIGIGFLTPDLAGPTSAAVSAWAGGVVGYAGGGALAIRWTPQDGPTPLGGHTGFVGFTYDVSANGAIPVGVAAHESPDGAAYYWDTTCIHRLEDPYSVQSVAYSISPSGNFIGGFVGEVDALDNDYLNAAVWDAQRNLILLKDSAGNRFQGKVLDVSNHGYAVGETRDGRGFIWHPSFDGVQSQFNGA